MHIVWQAVGATVLPTIGAFGITTLYNQRKEIKDWYNKLDLPPWRPPNAAFGPVWTALYSSMGYASYLVWRDGGGFQGEAHLPLALYGTQLAMNWAWSPIFFKCHSTKWAFWSIIGILGTAAATTAAMFPVNQNAGYLMLPYLAWLGLANSLAYYIWRKNPDGKPVEKK